MKFKFDTQNEPKRGLGAKSERVRKIPIFPSKSISPFVPMCGLDTAAFVMNLLDLHDLYASSSSSSMQYLSEHLAALFLSAALLSSKFSALCSYCFGEGNVPKCSSLKLLSSFTVLKLPLWLLEIFPMVNFF